MQISHQFAEERDERSVRPLASVTIHFDPQDDLHGVLTGLVIRGRLEALLRVLGAGPVSIPRDEFAEVLTRFAWLANLADARLEEMQVAARATHGMGWGSIATASGDEMSRETVRGRIIRAAERYADQGVWYDAAGVHVGTPDEAHAAIRDASARDRRS